LDVSPEAIVWCTGNMSGLHPDFDSAVEDVQSKRYNQTGKYQPPDFRFPYPDGSFDLVLAASVFPRMLASDVKHYMHEMVRVLKPGGAKSDHLLPAQ
jgi:ubiquinone/menaquinone biosynthesis C-methylase UbiE